MAQEVNTGTAQDEFYAATPPLEAKRVLLSRWAKEQYQGKEKLKLHYLDVRKAYFNGVPTRDLYVKLPPELGLGRQVVGKLQKCMYGTRDAGAIWEWTYTQALLKMGFVQGKSNPCCFKHPKWRLALVVHGDDFTCLGTDHHLDLYEKAIQESFEVELRGRMGNDEGDAQEMKILNRIVRITPQGISYEADPRHAELLVQSMGLDQTEGRRIFFTPGQKDCADEEVADNKLGHESEMPAIMSIRDHPRMRTKQGPDGPRQVRQQLIFK